METLKCSICKKEVPLKRKDKKFCSTYCRLMHHSREYYQQNKDNPEYRLKIKKNFRKWYDRNKDRQKASILRSYHTHKGVWALRTFNTTYREQLQDILPTKCFVCGKEGQEFIGIKDTSNTYRPKMRGFTNKPNEAKALLVEYSKNLVNLCSRDCLGKIHRRDFSFDGKDGYS